MALTKEQIKNLKPGDPIVIDGTVFEITEDGHILATCGGSAVWLDNPDNLTLPTGNRQSSTVNRQSEHAPTRLFKKGDKVRVVKCKGRDFNSWARIVRDQLLVVDIDETLDCDISVIAENGEFNSIDPAYLELVSPVEERMPYSIDPANTNVLFKHGEKFATFEDDDEAQEVCDRLNEEGRKGNTNE